MPSSVCVLLGKKEEEENGNAEFDKSRLCQPARAGVNSEYKNDRWQLNIVRGGS